MTTLKQDDLIKDSEGNICRVLGVCGKVVIVSIYDDIDEVSTTATESELKKWGYTWGTPAWEPEIRKDYWYLDEEGRAYLSTWLDDEIDNARRDFLGISKTKELAEAALLEIRRKLGK